MIDFIEEIWNIEIAINRVYEKIAKQAGINYVKQYILYHLQTNQNISQGQLAKDLLLPKQTVNTILIEWKQKNYIELVIDEKNKKEKKIRFTEKGSLFSKEALKDVHQIEHQVINKMGEAQTKNLLQANKLYLTHLKEALQNNESNI